jgi:hypothetical protein
MTRAANVFFGVILISTVWLWMLITINAENLQGWGWLFLICKILTACYITGPIYREYLR